MTSTIINIFGGPGVGKSTVAAGLFFRLKCMQQDVELLEEYAKHLVYEGRLDVLEKDQLTVFSRQHSKLRRLAEQRQLVVVDSPLLLSRIYFNAEKNLADLRLFAPLVIQLFESYNNFNVYLERNPDLPYETKGRVEKTVEEAKKIDEKVKRFLVSHSLPFTSVLASEEAVEVILGLLKKKKVLQEFS